MAEIKTTNTALEDVSRKKKEIPYKTKLRAKLSSYPQKTANNIKELLYDRIKRGHTSLVVESKPRMNVIVSLLRSGDFGIKCTSLGDDAEYYLFNLEQKK